MMNVDAERRALTGRIGPSGDAGGRQCGRARQAAQNVATAWRLVDDGQTVLIFCPERRSVEPFADVIVDLHERGALRSLLEADPNLLNTAIALGEEWLGADSAILKCLRLGVALHHGALPTAYRKEVERLLPRIRCPVLVAVGSEDSWSPPDQHAAMAALIPGAQLVVIAGS